MTFISPVSSPDAAQERAVLTQDAAGLFDGRDASYCSCIRAKRFAVFLVRI
jgi:hypothetical protein